MKLIKKLSAITLAIIMMCTASVGVLNVNAASAPAFTVNAVKSITTKNATISARITNPSKGTISQVGFLLGTSKNNLNTKKYDTLSAKHNYVNASFTMSKYSISLKPNTTYYYKFYIKINKKDYFSAVKSFKTTATPAFTINNPSSIKNTDATISAKITNPAKTKITTVGFQLGLSTNKLSTKKADSVSLTSSYVNASFNMKKYSVTLKKNTTYYYRFYITTGGETFYSDIKNFTTTNTTTSTTTNNKKYTAIPAIGISRIAQPAGKDTSCYISSIATLYGYKVGTYNNENYRIGGKDYTQTSSKLYKDVFKKNGSSNWVSNSTITYYGLKKQSFSMEKAYNALKQGKPVVIHGKNGNATHASIIIGYKGNGATLKASDFIVMEIKSGYPFESKVYDKGYWDNSTTLFKNNANKAPSSYFSSPSCYVTLSNWTSSLNGAMPNNMVTY